VYASWSGAFEKESTIFFTNVGVSACIYLFLDAVRVPRPSSTLRAAVSCATLGFLFSFCTFFRVSDIA
jgi:hypothetical protein